MKKILAIICIFSISGCSLGPQIFVAPIISGIIMWQEGEAHKYYNYNTTVLYSSVKRAANKLGLEITKDEEKSPGEHYLIVGAQDKFKIKIDKKEETISKISIRINFMGDKDYAELFYAEIDKQIKEIEF